MTDYIEELIREQLDLDHLGIDKAGEPRMIVRTGEHGHCTLAGIGQSDEGTDWEEQLKRRTKLAREIVG